MLLNVDQAHLILSLFKLQNGHHHISKFISLAEDQDDVLISELDIQRIDTRAVYIQTTYKNYKWNISYHNETWYKFDFQKKESLHFNPLNYISFEDNI